VDGGVLSQPVHTIHVECLPQQIPEKIVVDVEPLLVDDVVHVKDLKLPEGVKAVDGPDVVLIAVHMPRVEEVAAAPVEGAPAEPEVLTARKEEEPAEGEAADAKGGEKKKKEEKK
jgi:large subunit ribosomal protein L25